MPKFPVDAPKSKVIKTLQLLGFQMIRERLILEGIKELTIDHLIIIYMDSNDLVVGVDIFVCGLAAFDAPQATRALSSILQKQNRANVLKVVLAQTTQQTKALTLDNLDLKGLANFAIRILSFQIKLVDCI